MEQLTSFETPLNYSDTHTHCCEWFRVVFAKEAENYFVRLGGALQFNIEVTHNFSARSRLLSFFY